MRSKVSISRFNLNQLDHIANHINPDKIAHFQSARSHPKPQQPRTNRTFSWKHIQFRIAISSTLLQYVSLDNLPSLKHIRPSYFPVNLTSLITCWKIRIGANRTINFRDNTWNTKTRKWNVCFCKRTCD
jgi:hypothetical protein